MPQENFEQFRSDNPYEVLGVSPSTPKPEIKMAYRKLASKWHPDKHVKDGRNTTEIMKKITAAYEAIEKGATDKHNATEKENPFSRQTSENPFGQKKYGFSSTGAWERKPSEERAKEEQRGERGFQQQQGGGYGGGFGFFDDILKDLFGARSHFQEKPQQKTGNAHTADSGSGFSQKRKATASEKETRETKERKTYNEQKQKAEEELKRAEKESKEKKEKAQADAIRKKEYEAEMRKKRNGAEKAKTAIDGMLKNPNIPDNIKMNIIKNMYR
jgi:curved DNA-binding protein CbpA